MKSLTKIYNQQIDKVCSLINKLNRAKSPLTRNRISNQLSEAQAYSRELDGLRAESYQLAGRMISEVKETDLINR